MVQQSTSAIPTIINTLKAWGDANIANDTTFVTVGPVIGDGSGMLPSYWMIGVDSPDSLLAATASTGKQTPVTFNSATRPREDTGILTCSIASWDGGSDCQVAMNTAFGILAKLENNLRQPIDGPALGLTGTGFRLLKVDLGNYRLSLDQTDLGASALVIFDLAYTARI